MARFVPLSKKSQARNSFSVGFDHTTNGIPPILVKIGNGPAKSFFVDANRKIIPTNLAKLFKRNAAFTQWRYRFVQIGWRDGNHDSRLRFIKQNCSRVRAGRVRATHRATATVDVGTEECLRIETTLGERDCEPTFGTIVRAFHYTVADQTANGVLNFDFVRKIDLRRRTNFQAVTNFQIL